jgi:hypothetical protein
MLGAPSSAGRQLVTASRTNEAGGEPIRDIAHSYKVHNSTISRLTKSDSRCSPYHTIFISCLSSLAKMFFGMSAWTPRTMSTTWVTRKLTAMLHRAYASSSLIFA